jgi:hypothetical protein
MGSTGCVEVGHDNSFKKRKLPVSLVVQKITEQWIL